MKRSALLLPAVVAALSLAACGSGNDDVRTNGSAPRDPDQASTTTAPDTGGGGGPPAHRVVWQQVTAGGFVPLQAVAAEVPEVTIYGDGRVILGVPDEDRYDRPASLRLAHISADEVTSLLDAADASGFFDQGTDFGEPGVSDMGTTTVTMRGTGAPRTVSVYALDYDDSSSIGQPFGLTKGQAAARAGLSKLLARARALGDDAEPYAPVRVRATLFDPATAGEVETNAASAWPGPAFAEFPPPTEGSTASCLVIEDDDARAVYEAARASSTNVFTSGTDTRLVIVAPLVPGQEGCPS